MKQIFLIMLFAAAALAQSVSRLIPLKHVSTESVMPMVSSFGRGQVVATQEPRGRYLALTGPTELLDEIEKAIQRLDVAPPELKNVESTFHVLQAYNAGEPAAALPKELDGVAQQLRGMFGFKNVRLLETSVLRGRANSGSETGGMMPSPTKIDTPARYLIRFGTLNTTADDKGLRIRYNALRVNFTVWQQASNGNVYTQEIGINTDIDIREGQKVVVGKTSVDSNSQALFLVVSAKVVD